MLVLNVWSIFVNNYALNSESLKQKVPQQCGTKTQVIVIGCGQYSLLLFEVVCFFKSHSTLRKKLNKPSKLIWYIKCF